MISCDFHDLTWYFIAVPSLNISLIECEGLFKITSFIKKLLKKILSTLYKIVLNVTSWAKMLLVGDYFVTDLSLTASKRVNSVTTFFFNSLFVKNKISIVNSVLKLVKPEKVVTFLEPQRFQQSVNLS